MARNWKAAYSEKLKDPRWQRKRLEVLERDGWACQLCGTKDKTLHVHHRQYQTGYEPWDYPPHYLVTLCEGCHEEESGAHREAEGYLRDTIARAGLWSRDIANLAKLVAYLHLGEEKIGHSASESLQMLRWLSLSDNCIWALHKAAEVAHHNQICVAVYGVTRDAP